MSAEIRIRRATENDLPALLRIYNDAILTTTATFDLEPKTLEERREWLLKRRPEHPLVVVERGDVPSDGSAVLGWASLSPWSDRAGYRITAEPSIYVDVSARGKGLGRILMEWAITEGDRQGFRSLISRIDATNTVSVDLHLKYGFEKVGHLHEVGMKFGRLIDVVLLQRTNSSFRADRW